MSVERTRSRTHGGDAGPAGRPAGRGLLPHPRRALRDHAARRPRRRGGQGRGAAAATTPGPGRRRCGTGVSTYYLGVNRNKRSIALDFKDADDLARGAGAGGAGRRRRSRTSGPGGLAPVRPRLRRRSRPRTRRVVYASISGFGSGEEGAKLPGYDLIVQAISGLMSLTGDPDGPPYRAGISVFDVMAGLHATIGVLAALRTRDETGRGQHVEVNLLSSALSGLVNQSSAYVAGGTVPFRMGNSHPSLFPYEPLPCADRDLIVTAGNDAPVPQARRGARRARARRRPAVRPQRGPHRQPRRAAPAAGRAAADPHGDGVVRRRSSPRACRAARSTPSTAASPSPRASASTRSSTSARATRPCRRRATRSPSPRRRPATPAAARRSTSTATRSAPGLEETP